MMTGYRLSRNLVLEDRERTADGAGGFAESWVSLGQVWAELRSGRSRDARSSSGLTARSTHRIYVRAAPHGAPSRPATGQRFREGARIYSILSVAEADRDARHLVCSVIEEIAQ